MKKSQPNHKFQQLLTGWMDYTEIPCDKAQTGKLLQVILPCALSIWAVWQNSTSYFKIM